MVCRSATNRGSRRSNTMACQLDTFGLRPDPICGWFPLRCAEFRWGPTLAGPTIPRGIHYFGHLGSSWGYLGSTWGPVQASCTDQVPHTGQLGALSRPAVLTRSPIQVHLGPCPGNFEPRVTPRWPGQHILARSGSTDQLSIY